MQWAGLAGKDNLLLEKPQVWDVTDYPPLPAQLDDQTTLWGFLRLDLLYTPFLSTWEE